MKHFFSSPQSLAVIQLLLVNNAQSSNIVQPSRNEYQIRNIQEDGSSEVIRADARCPCLTYQELKLENSQIVNATEFLGKNIDVTKYGIGCAPHDERSKDCSRPNYCGVTIPRRQDCDKSWCSRSWCYIDKNNCDLYNSESVLYSDRYYSFATCGFMDTFSNPYNIAPLRGKTFNVALNANTGGWKGSYNPEGSFAMNNLWEGPLVQFIEEAALRGDFTLNVTRPPDRLRNHSMQYFDSKSSFSYCVYAVALGYLDFCIAGYDITNQRASITPFFQTFSNDIYLVLFSDAEPATWETFVANIGRVFKPFTWGTWVTIVLFLFLLGFIMFILEFRSPGSSYPSEIPSLLKEEGTGQVNIIMRKVPLVVNIANSIYRSTLAFCHQSYEQRVITIEGKINLFAISSFILIVTAIYTANLAAILTTGIQQKRINSIDEAIQKGYNFCAERNVGTYISELYDFDLNLLVPDPVELGGDNRPGFTCPQCSARTRVFNFMRKTHSDSGLYCNAAFAFDQDLQMHHRYGDHCDKENVILLGKVEAGIPISSNVFEGLSSLFHELKYKGVLEKALVNKYPDSQCPSNGGTGTSLEVIQLSGVWIFCLSFAVVALLTKILLKIWKFIRKSDNRENYYSYDQWGNPTRQDDMDGLLIPNKTIEPTDHDYNTSESSEIKVDHVEEAFEVDE